VPSLGARHPGRNWHPRRMGHSGCDSDEAARQSPARAAGVLTGREIASLRSYQDKARSLLPFATPTELFHSGRVRKSFPTAAAMRSCQRGRSCLSSMRPSAGHDTPFSRLHPPLRPLPPPIGGICSSAPSTRLFAATHRRIRCAAGPDDPIEENSTMADPRLEALTPQTSSRRVAATGGPVA
jgi:hypothetical protein